MFSQDDIDAVLSEAQQAVDSLVDDVSGLADPPGEPANDRAPAAAAKPAAGPEPVQRLLKMKVPLIVRLAEQKMPLQEILKLMPGTILEFSRRCDAELDLLANNHQIGTGVAVKVDEHFGLRVTYIGDLKERITSLAG